METLLHRYHSRPGQTPLIFRRFRDAAGRSSYEVIAEETDALPRSARLLDLACGDGYLLSLLASKGFARLIGVDRSPEELAAARVRLAPSVELACQDAGAMSLPAGSVDMVLCHLALMLMDPVEVVLSEIARILEPGGVLVAVVNRYLQDPVFEVHRRELHRVTVEAGMDRLRLGDPRAYTVEGLGELLRGQGFDGEDLVIQDFEVQARVIPPALWGMFRSMYDVFRLPEAAQSTLGERLLRRWGPLQDEGGLLTCAMGMRLVRCRTPSSSRTP